MEAAVGPGSIAAEVNRLNAGDGIESGQSGGIVGSDDLGVFEAGAKGGANLGRDLGEGVEDFPGGGVTDGVDGDLPAPLHQFRDSLL